MHIIKQDSSCGFWYDDNDEDVIFCFSATLKILHSVLSFTSHLNDSSESIDPNPAPDSRLGV